MQDELTTKEAKLHQDELITKVAEVAELCLDDLTTKVAKLLEELQTYKTKPTKACSKRIRLLLGNIKKNTSTYRAHLLSLDKASK